MYFLTLSHFEVFSELYSGRIGIFITFNANKLETRMHSSRMHTAHSSSHPGRVCTRHPLEQTPPGADTPWEQTLPGADTPREQTPPP